MCKRKAVEFEDWYTNGSKVYVYPDQVVAVRQHSEENATAMIDTTGMSYTVLSSPFAVMEKLDSAQ